MAIETTNQGYLDAASYYADPENITVPDQTHQAHVKGINSYILATAIPAGGGGGGDVTSEEFLDVKQAQGLLAIQQAISAGTTVNSNYLYAVDEYEDETGISASEATYEGGTSSYRTGTSSTHSLLIQSEESTAVTDGSAYFYDSSGTTKGPLTANGSAQTDIPVLDSPYADDSSLGIDFNGSSAVDVPDNASYTIGSGEFTTEGWFKVTNGTATQMIFSHGATSANYAWNIYVNSNALNGFMTASAGTYNASYAVGGGTVVNGTWHHFSMVRDSDTLRLYLDGAQVDTASVTGVTNYDAPSTPQVGARTSSAARSFLTGSTADCRLEVGTCRYPDGTTFTVPTTRPADGTNDIIIEGSSSTGKIVDAVGAVVSLEGAPSVNSDPYGGTEPIISFTSGNTDEVTAPDNALWTPASGGLYSIELWFKADTVAGTQYLISHTGVGSAFAWALTIESGQLRWNADNDGNASGVIRITGGTIVAGTWYHVAVVYDGTDETMYLDGSSIGTITQRDVYDSANIIRVGTGFSSSQDFAGGYITDVQIWKGTATRSGAFTPPTSKPVVSTEDFYLEHDIDKTDGWGNATDSLDATGAHTVTANGDARHTLSVSKFGNSSIHFDGTGDNITIPHSDDWAIDNGGSYTIELQFNPSSVSGSQSLIAQTGTVGEGNQFAWNLYLASAVPTFIISTNGTTGSLNTVSSSSSVSIDTWYHLAVVFDGSNIKMYLDGTQVGSTTQNNYFDSARALWLGDREYATLTYTGYMEEVSILKGTAKYTTAFTAPTAPYVLAANDLELDSITFTAGTAPTKATMVVVMEPIDSVTINTDFIGYISPTASFANKGTFTLTYAGVDPLSGGNIYTSDDLDLTGLTSGTSIRYYLRGANTKDLRVHATYIYYAS